MRIGEVAMLTGVPTSTIRYYEQIEVLPAPDRVNGIRVYRPETVELLRFIATATRTGFTLSETKTLLAALASGEDPSDECRRLTSQKLTELDRKIEDLRRMQAVLGSGKECTCSSPDTCYLSTNGGS